MKKQAKARQSEFLKLRKKVGMERQEEAEKFFQVCKKTIKNWDTKGAPPLAMRLLRYRDKWDCAAHGPEWTGWRFSRGRLVNAREKLIFTPERLRLWPTVCDRLDRLEAEAAKRRACPVMRAIRKMVGWAGKPDQRRKPWPTT